MALRAVDLWSTLCAEDHTNFLIMALRAVDLWSTLCAEDHTNFLIMALRAVDLWSTLCAEDHTNFLFDGPSGVTERSEGNRGTKVASEGRNSVPGRSSNEKERGTKLR